MFKVWICILSWASSYNGSPAISSVEVAWHSDCVRVGQTFVGKSSIRSYQCVEVWKRTK